ASPPGALCVLGRRRRSTRRRHPRSTPGAPGGPTRRSDRRHRRRGTRRAARTRQTQTGPSVASPHGVHLAVHTENHADGPTTWWTLPLPPNPTTSRDAPTMGRPRRGPPRRLVSTGGPPARPHDPP